MYVYMWLCSVRLCAGIHYMCNISVSVSSDPGDVVDILPLSHCPLVSAQNHLGTLHSVS